MLPRRCAIALQSTRMDMSSHTASAIDSNEVALSTLESNSAQPRPRLGSKGRFGQTEGVRYRTRSGSTIRSGRSFIKTGDTYKDSI